MPNDFITMSAIANRAVATLYNTIVLAGLVNRDYDSEFVAGRGSIVNARVPATFTAMEYDRAEGITIQDADEGTIPVELDTILDVSFAVTSEDLTLDIVDFAEQLLNPAMEAIAQGVDERLAEALVTQARAHTPDWLANGSTTPNAAWREARAILSRQKLPFANRYAVLSPEAVSDALGDELLVRADQSGTTDGLNEANLGRKFGFDNYESQAFGGGPGLRGEADGVAFHRDAVILASRTLSQPKGAAQSAIASYKGLGLRVVYDYDIDKKQDVVSVDTLIGVQDLRSNAAVELEFGQGS